MDPSPLKLHFVRFAHYNQWANDRLIPAALALPLEDYERDCGVFFKSLKGTLNHLVVADRIWLHRLTGDGPTYDRLDYIVYEDRDEFARARRAEDARLISAVAAIEPERLIGTMTFTMLDGSQRTEPLAANLAHIFNHQTHHRGQAHAILTRLAGKSLALDLLYFMREQPALS